MLKKLFYVLIGPVIGVTGLLAFMGFGANLVLDGPDLSPELNRSGMVASLMMILFGMIVGWINRKVTLN